MKSVSAFLFAVQIAVAVYAMQTKPGPTEFEDYMMARLKQSARLQKLSQSDDFLSSMIKLGCSSSPDECAELTRATLDVKTVDLIVVEAGTITWPNGREVCMGFFSKWHCWPDKTAH
jgi:hypothetical protein